MKLITVVIPSYNVAQYLPRCLDSLLYDKDIWPYLDLIIVDDGSSDNTSQVAKDYQKRYDCVSVISKENGGHGSTINAGIKQAKGKYFKVIDADDWANIWDFPRFVMDLKNQDADILITDFKQDLLYDNMEIDFAFYDDQGTCAIEKIAETVDSTQNFFFRFSMHSMCVKLESLKQVWDDGLLEHTFYVDQQFVAKVLSCAKTYRTLDYDIYRYFIGRPDQSVNSFGKHIDDHERVLLWLMQFCLSESIANRPYLQKVIRRQIKLMLGTHQRAYHEQSFGHRNSAERRRFFRTVRADYPEFLLSKS